MLCAQFPVLLSRKDEIDAAYPAADSEVDALVNLGVHRCRRSGDDLAYLIRATKAAPSSDLLQVRSFAESHYPQFGLALEAHVNPVRHRCPAFPFATVTVNLSTGPRWSVNHRAARTANLPSFSPPRRRCSLSTHAVSVGEVKAKALDNSKGL
jgi:hypothetical protein